MRLLASTFIVAATSLGATGAALATPLSASTILHDFNAVIYTSASTTADIEGAAVIGGHFSGATVYNNPTATQPAGYGALTVYGATSGNPININNGGSAYVGGAHGAIVNFNGGGGYLGAPSATIADFAATLNSFSTTLSQLAATGTLPAATNNEVIKATPGAGGVAVFDLTAAELAAIPSFKVDLNGASTVVFNVSGNSVNFNANDESGTAGAHNIIWNFYDATGTVAINTQLGGTVLATGATVTNNNQIDGVLVANAWNGSGEVHDWQFTGNLPPADPTPVPEPASIAVLAAGLLGLAAFRLRGRPAVVRSR